MSGHVMKQADEKRGQYCECNDNSGECSLMITINTTIVFLVNVNQLNSESQM